MTLLISDANILIDMETADLLEPMFRLPERFAVPNTLYIEELAELHAHLPGLGLSVLEVRAEFVAEAFRLGGLYRNAGHNDLLALALAKQETCAILTGDKFLRQAAELEQLVARGTLWLMERLHRSRLLALDELEHAYDLMHRGGRRLPKDEIQRQLQRLRGR